MTGRLPADSMHRIVSALAILYETWGFGRTRFSAVRGSFA